MMRLQFAYRYTINDLSNFFENNFILTISMGFFIVWEFAFIMLLSMYSLERNNYQQYLIITDLTLITIQLFIFNFSFGYYRRLQNSQYFRHYSLILSYMMTIPLSIYVFVLSCIDNYCFKGTKIYFLLLVYIFTMTFW